ncbi:hypothetical protein M501DRAFT_985909 [Patellaria atrata CBS 101060]|uniref:Uncharacterized protein n=1 Tax=Patellaria atrata CBS 101060 TaxID=1346257 RepID=A0A9P4VSB4_9PEZI|nr:hypothetical protein M501DRAFT_985909 [Patellaria atrata CBS 101060]
MSSTLIAFFYVAPYCARKVELFGSWDNFSTPYPMQKDSRRGERNWKGCHTFHDIICDGDGHLVDGKREGGLKMGGTYWYYYRLDEDMENFDHTKLSTTACPLLPGQCMNILEVPAEDSSLCSPNSTIYTMDPQDRFVTPRPAPNPSHPRTPKSRPEAISCEKNSKRRLPTPPENLLLSISHNPTKPSPTERQIRSAGTPGRELKTALKRIKSLPSRRKPKVVQHSRGRSLSDEAEMKKIDEKPLPPPATSHSAISASSGPSLPSNQKKIFSPLRSHPVHAGDNILHGRSPSSTSTSETQTDRSNRARSSWYLQRDSSPQTHTRSSSLSAVQSRSASPVTSTSVKRRSTSLPRLHEPSPLRNVVICEKWLVNPQMDAPNQIMEIDETDIDIRPSALSLMVDPMSEYRFGNPGASSRHRNSGPPNFSKLLSNPGNEDHEASNMDMNPYFPVSEDFPSNTPAANRESTALTINEIMEPIEALHPTVQRLQRPVLLRSQFSAWSSASEGPVSPISPISEPSPLHSPTSSSPTFSTGTVGSGETSPHRLSNQSIMPMEDYFSRHADHPNTARKETSDTTTPGFPTPGEDFYDHLQIRGSVDTGSRRNGGCFVPETDRGFGKFQGYGLPRDRTDSEVTITKCESPIMSLIPPPSEITYMDGLTPMEELIIDFGYLSDTVV